MNKTKNKEKIKNLKEYQSINSILNNTNNNTIILNSILGQNQIEAHHQYNNNINTNIINDQRNHYRKRKEGNIKVGGLKNKNRYSRRKVERYMFFFVFSPCEHNVVNGWEGRLLLKKQGLIVSNSITSNQYSRIQKYDPSGNEMKY